MGRDLPPLGCSAFQQVPVAAHVSNRMDQNLKLESCAPEDAAAFMEVMLACWRGTVPDNSTAYRETETSLRQALGGTGYGVLLYRDGRAIGCGRYVAVPGPSYADLSWVEIKRIGILTEYRRLDFGLMIHDGLETVARERGFGGAQLAVRSDQPRLLAYWLRQGYVEADDVTLTTENPRTPKPFYMRKRYVPQP